MGEEFDVLGRVEVGAKVEVSEVDGAEEGVVGDDRVEKDVDGRERADLGGGRAVPLHLPHGVVNRGGGGGVVNGAEGPGSLDGWGPARAERKVRGELEGSRLRTGAAEEEMEVVAGEGR